MRWLAIASILIPAGFFAGVQGYGTTISIAVSYCPASSTLATGTGSPSPTTSETPISTPVLIYLAQGLAKRADLQFISSFGGTINTNPVNALTWVFTSNGELLTEDGRSMSTTDLDPLRFFPAAPKLGISIVWEVSPNKTVSWKNENFPTGQAGFCLVDSVVWIYFREPSAGCAPVTLGAIRKEDVILAVSSISTSATQTQSTLGTASASTSSTLGAIVGALARAEPVGCLTSPIGSLALNSPNTTVSTLEQCVDICAAYISSDIDYHYVGVQFGNQCYCGSSLNPITGPAPAGSCDLPCGGDSIETCGGNTAMSIYVIVSRASTGSTTLRPSVATTTGSSGTGYPTTTGDPNCFDGSGFDGTINNNYLILCDTGLPGFDLTAVDAQDLAECIEQCGSFAPSGNGDRCVAVEYDILVTELPCKLKSEVGPIDRGANIFAQAAILRDLPGAPSITFGSVTAMPSIGSTSTALSSALSSTTIIGTTITKSSSLPSTSSRAPSFHSASTSATKTTGSAISTSRSTASAQSPSISPRASTTANAIVVSSFASTSGYSTPTASLCPTYNHQILNVNSDSYPYEVECGTTLIGTVLNGNSTTAASLMDCVSFCTLYNIALPYQCLGVSFTGTNQGGGANCFLLGSVTGTVCTPERDGARLIWAQYSAARDQICGPTPSSSPAAPSSSTSRASGSSATTLVPQSPPTTFTATSSTTPPRTASSSSVLATSPSSSSLPLSSSGTVISSSSLASSSTPRPTSSSTSMTTPTTTATTTTRVVFTSSLPLSSVTSTTATLSSTSTIDSRSSTLPSSLVTTITTSASSTTPYTELPCPAAPTGTDGYNAECPSPTPTPNPAGSPQCYYYNFTQQDYPSSNYEIECASSFSGASLQPLITFDVEDCIYYCQNANYLSRVANPSGPPGCVGVTFNNTITSQGGINNCLRYSSITCVTRGERNFDSARLLYSGYPAMLDYGPGYACSP